MRSAVKAAFRKVMKVPSRLGRLRARMLTAANSRNDFLAYCATIRPYRKLIATMPPADQGGLLIVSGRGMNVVWAQVWTLLSLCGRANRLKPYVLTTRTQEHLNRYFRLLDIELLYLDDLVDRVDTPLPSDCLSRIEAAQTFEDFRALVLDRVPIGDIALSTYCRYHGTGMVDTRQQSVRDSVRQWIEQVWRAMVVSGDIFARYDIRSTYHTEVFMEEYGGIYYAALNAGIKVIRFAGTVRDDAYIIQHRTWEDDRLHHAALAHSSWESVRVLPEWDRIRTELEQNFVDRYGNKWHRSKRNHLASRIDDPVTARAELGVPDERKVAVVYSHILYDTIFFFGTDLFKDYATWLIETVREAVANDKLEWFIKVHPSNIWRGEMGSMLGGRYEEERLIEEHVGTLPPHVHIVPANSHISPLAWMQLADFGITVRGTSGLEMAALGRTVITAGTGRYEGRGFTCDPETQDAYCDLLHRLPDIPQITPEQTELAQRYAHGIFILKPFTLSSLEPRLRAGRKEVLASDDLVYIPRPLPANILPDDLRELADFLLDDSRVDLLSDASYFAEESRSRSIKYAVS